MQSIGFLGPAFFLTQLSNVRTLALAVLCMACSQGSDAFTQSGLYSNHQDIEPRYAVNQLAGAVGANSGLYIIPVVIQVFLNHFVFGMDPLAAIQHPRLIPNVVLCEDWTFIDGDHIELSQETKVFLEQLGHVLKDQATGGTLCRKGCSWFLCGE